MYTVYLLHFTRPYRQGTHRHYIGYTNNMERRMKQHRTGGGARLVKHAIGIGIEFEVAMTQECETRVEARRMELAWKARHGASRMCPICNRNGQEQ